MPVNLIRDADIHAISIVGKGANRKRFFLRKADADASETLSAGRLVKAEDWSAVYCVVAEPDWHENSGIGGPDIEDRWADEDEIRKAAHRFMENGGLVSKMHESLEPYGQLVENAVALADFTVNGETIRKGSWYIAITPSDEGKEAIEKGEFTGVSIEGLAVRELVEKGAICGECGYPHTGSGETCGDCSEGSTQDAPTVGVVEKTLLQKIAEKVGLKPEEIEAINKADRTFGEIIAQREFDHVLPEALDSFRDAVWYAFFPNDPEAADPVTLITESCDEFKAWALDKLENVPVEKAERAKALGVELDPEGSTQPASTKDGDMALTDSERQEFDSLQKEVADLPGKVTAELAKALGGNVADEKPTAESIAKQVKALAGVTDESELAKKVSKIEADIAKLAEGGSTQPREGDDDAPISKAEAVERVEKAFKREGVNPALAGVLGG